VLKGPQGTLYGRNATGGAINVISRKPVLGSYGGALAAEYGNYAAVRLDGAVNLPVGETAALRAAATYVRHDGYMKDGTDQQNDLGGRLSFRWEPTNEVSVNIVGDYARQRGRGVGGTAVDSGIENRYGYVSPQGAAFVTSQPNLVLGRPFAAFTTPLYMRNSFWGLSATIDWRTPIGTVTYDFSKGGDYVQIASETELSEGTTEFQSLKLVRHSWLSELRLPYCCFNQPRNSSSVCGFQSKSTASPYEVNEPSSPTK